MRWLRLLPLLIAPLACPSLAATVAAGDGHSCRIRIETGKVDCWGANQSGQLGTGTAGGMTPNPVTVADLSGVEAITAGLDHVCALQAGEVYCWGLGLQGQLGTGEFESSAIPRHVVIPGAAMRIDAGEFHTCVVTYEGEAYCWGDNSRGQLGTGTYDGSASPQKVQLTGGFSEVSAGRDHTCGVVDGSAYCWGGNAFGQSAGASEQDQLLPVPVAALIDVDAISAGVDFSCALQQGEVHCWGRSLEAPGVESFLPVPAPVPLAGATAVVAGDLRACATVATELFCWGSNEFGMLGDGSSATWKATPANVTDLTEVSSVALGSRHTCAHAADGVACWGIDPEEQLGDRHSETLGLALPSEVSGVDDVTSLDGRWNHSCAVSDGNVLCWGDNADGAVDPYAAASPVPFPRRVTGASGAVGVATGSRQSCALDMDGAVHCWGRDLTGNIVPPTMVELPSPASMVTAGGRHACALVHAGATRQVFCWGENAFGQLGTDDTVSRIAPVPVEFMPDDLDIVDLAAGDVHTCALSAGGNAYCWGGGSRGQLGLGTFEDRGVPGMIEGLDDVIRIRAGLHHTCAQRLVELPGETTQVLCWGSDAFGQAGNGVASAEDVSVPGYVVGNMALLGAGGDGACAGKDDGEVHCWGRGSEGQLASPPLPQVPSPIAGAFAGISSIAMGLSHSCALTSGGVVQCAGSGMLGQRGDGTRLFVTTPIALDAVFLDHFE